MFRFKCAGCGQWHEDMPSIATDAPIHFHSIPPDERDARCHLDSDVCVVDDECFYVRACLAIPVHRSDDDFIWSVWVSLSKASFIQFAENFDKAKRSHVGPFFGWFSSELPPYPDTLHLKTMVHLRDDFQRPLIELEPTDHPLAVDQREGITMQRLGEIWGHWERIWAKEGYVETGG